VGNPHNPAIPLDGLHCACSQALWGLLNLERDFLAFGQGLETASVDCGEMHEHIFAAIIRSDEPETLALVEPLHDTSIHNLEPRYIREK